MRIALPSGWSEDSYEGQPYVRTGGTGLPCAVLVHGMNDAGLGWVRVARGLQDRFDVVMPDSRGHGTNTRPTPFTIDDMADDLADLIDHLGVAPVLLVGHSLGGLIVADFAARYPELLDRLVVVDSSYSLATKLGGTRLAGVLIVLSRAWPRHLPYAAVRRVFRVLYKSWTDEERDTMAQALVEASQRPGRGLSSRLGRRDWTAVLRQIERPTLILTSDKGMIKPKERELLVAVLPHGRSAHIPGAAHNIQRDNYDGFMRALESFVGAPS